MKKLIAKYRSLPKEVRMMLAMAGLGGGVYGIVRLIQRVLPRGTSQFTVILWVVGVILLVSLVAWLISRLFSRGARKRSRKMEQDLAGDADRGPESMTSRAAIKANNEKFFGAIKDMRKSLGISVYDLPWYIVIGDSGCGKTKLINEGGLTFSAGKPENYQLGTLNYNWWFTEDAVFIDMAGRLINPQDDADHREWQAFLDTIAKGRSGYPINGVVVCVSVEHLLADSPEKHEEDANTILERLRDLQKKLGVTFATYLVITKCDKILGFMQFFDRAERDITVKNQMFGWSKPGDFKDLRDPEQFGSDFDTLSGRLNELRLRRLNDDADEDELGMAYVFPEEFRELRDPLLIYVRTLFPMIKNPRALKNLVFRGVYFTSATQKGSLILKALTQRLGAEAAQQFQPIENLYPRPRPLFVKDLLFKKVFPEHGLVFRNEDQVARNRRLSKLLWIGTAVTSVVMVASLAWSAWSFGNVIGEPREHGRRSVEQVVATDGVARTPVEALKFAKQLKQDVDALDKAAFAARIASLWHDHREPIEDLNEIRVALFAHGVLRPVLRDVSKALRETKLSDLAADANAVEKYETYTAALEQYIKWFACGGVAPDGTDQDDFNTLCKVVRDTPGDKYARSIIKRTQNLEEEADLYEEAADYFTYISSTGRDGRAGLFTARELAGESTGPDAVDPVATIKAAIENVRPYLNSYAMLSATHPNGTISEWMRIRDACDKVQSSYLKIVEAGGGDDIKTIAQAGVFRNEFNDQFTILAGALENCTWQQEPSGGEYLVIPPLAEAVWKQRQKWTGFQDRLRGALNNGCNLEGARAAEVESAIAAVSADSPNRRGLDYVLFNSLKDAGLFGSDGQLLDSKLFADEAGLKIAVREVYEQYDHILTLKREERADDALVPTADAESAKTILDEMNQKLASAGEGNVTTVAGWLDQLDTEVYLEGASEGEAAAQNDLALTRIDALPVDDWRSASLHRVYVNYRKLIDRNETALALTAMNKQLDQLGEWGFIELYTDYRSMKGDTEYSIDAPTARDFAARPPPESEPTRSVPARRRRGRSRPRTGSARAPAPTRSPSRSGARASATGFVPTCAMPETFSKAADECAWLVYMLEGLVSGEDFLRSADGANRLNEFCRDKVKSQWVTYVGRYTQAWKRAYDARLSRPLVPLAKLRDHGRWPTLATAFETRPGVDLEKDPLFVAQQLSAALEQILHAVRWPFFYAPNTLQDQPNWTDPKSLDWSDSPGRDDAMRQIEAAYIQAVNENWEGLRFAWEAKRPPSDSDSANAPPWESTAQEFFAYGPDGRDGAWTRLGTAMAKYTDLDALANADDDQRDRETPAGIPWGELDKQRGLRGLGDEGLTQTLVDFESAAQKLLDVELTRKLVALQGEFLPDEQPFGGWPYLNEEGGRQSALDTVDFGDFKSFLDAVGKWEEKVGHLDERLPVDLESRKARRRFVENCGLWRNDFLKLVRRSEPDPLSVELEYGDPRVEPKGDDQIEDTPQHYYFKVLFSIGLRVNERSANASDDIEFLTQNGPGQKRLTTWTWRQPNGEQQVSFKLREPVPRVREGSRGTAGRTSRALSYPVDLNPLRLGRGSPLALCAYLHRYGRKVEDGPWVTSHFLELKNEFAKVTAKVVLDKETRIGAKFMFTLNRSLPDPIVRLEQ